MHDPRDREEPQAGVNLLVYAFLMALSFLQRPGEATFDTKFALVADPGPFLARTLHLWNAQSSFGELQNQAYGYIFPQGTFFLLGDRLGMPDWISQRLWSGLLLIVAYEGARRLSRAIGVGGPSDWVASMAGLAYAFAPRLLGLVGVLTAEILPTAVLPWVVLPLVLSQRGRLTPLRGALWSGVAVLCMGGVNAVEDLAALPLPALVVVCGLRLPAGRRLAGWWAAAVTVACAWWLLPLLVLGKYSPPFLDYIETSAATAGPLGWTNVTRGADHWLAYVFVGGRPWWPAAFDLAVDPWLVATAAVVAAISFVGVFHRRMPWRMPLTLSVLIGLTCLTLAHGGALGSPLSGGVRGLLDGVLAPLRNVHKVDPLVRLPLALGFAHAASEIAALSRRAAAGRGWLSGRPLDSRRVAGPLALVLLTVLLAGSAQPAFADRLRKSGWTDVPEAWYQAAEYLDHHTGDARALVIPGSGFGLQWWGWTIDEPLQGLARSPWAARSQIPLTPGQTIRFLDSIEERLEDGDGSPELADLLARAGISHVVVRRDIDLFASGVPAPDRVDLAVARSPGLELVRSFGRSGFGQQSMIDIYRVERPVRLVEATPFGNVRTLDGGPEDVLTALESGALRARQPVVIGADADAAAGTRRPDIVADGYRRRERQFGRVHDAVSQMMSEREEYRVSRAAHDYPGADGMPRAHVEYSGISAVTASSSYGYVDTLGAVRPEQGPYAALDGTDETFWRSAPLERPVGQWLRFAFRRAEPVPSLTFRVGVNPLLGVPVRQIRVTTDSESADALVDPVSGKAAVTLSGAPTSSVRVTVTKTLGDPDTGVVTIRGIAIPGVDVGRYLVVPSAGAGAGARTSFVFRARPSRRACVNVGLGPSCDLSEARPSEEERELARTFTVDHAGRWRVSGIAVARTTRATLRLLQPIGARVRVRGSTVFGDDPSVASPYAFDGDPNTPWLSSPADPAPSLRVEWERPHTISRVVVDGAMVPAESPSLLLIRSGARERRVRLGPESFGYFRPLTARKIRLTFPRRLGDGIPQPLGIGEVSFDGLRRVTYSPKADTPSGAICGLGPEVRVDGVRYRTRIDGPLSAVITGLPLRLQSCDGPVRLAAGRHTLVAMSTAQFAVSGLSLRPASPGATGRVASRDVAITSWHSNERSLRVAAGPRSLLRVADNANAGWEARLDGRRLTPVRVDGWQQGYILPAGDGGVVTLEFAPDGPYRLALLVGAILAALLVGAAAGSLAVRRRPPASEDPRRVADRMDPSATWRPVTVAAAILGAYVLGGVAVAGGAVVAVLMRRRPSACLPTAGAAIASAGIMSALFPSTQLGDAPFLADLLAGMAVGICAMSVLAWRTGEETV